MKFRQTIAIAAIALATLGVSAANATSFLVDAKNNSSTGGVGLASLSLTVGQSFTVTSNTDDLWSLGALPRYSDGNGLVADRYATATDDSGQLIGTLIGQDFGLWVQDGYSAPFGSLVGNINGTYQFLGANFSGTAWDTGTLYLYNWDSYAPDNTGSIGFIGVDVTAVPEPATWAMFLLGFGAIGWTLRANRKAVAVTA